MVERSWQLCRCHNRQRKQNFGCPFLWRQGKVMRAPPRRRQRNPSRWPFERGGSSSVWNDANLGLWRKGWIRTLQCKLSQVKRFRGRFGAVGPTRTHRKVNRCPRHRWVRMWRHGWWGPEPPIQTRTRSIIPRRHIKRGFELLPARYIRWRGGFNLQRDAPGRRWCHLGLLNHLLI